jgi:hypothetical protein
MVSRRRILRVAALFALLAVPAQISAGYWLLEIRTEGAWSSADNALANFVFWPQRIAALFGWPGDNSVLSFIIGCAGWSFIGAVVAAIWRRREDATSTI